MTNVIVSEIASATALVINSDFDGDVLVVKSVKIIHGTPVYDLRQASRQQIRLLDQKNSTELGDCSSMFLRSLIDHVTGPIKDRLLRFI